MLPHVDDQLSAGWCLACGGSHICTCIGTGRTHAATFPIHDECPVGCDKRPRNRQLNDEHRQCLVSSIRGPTDNLSAFCAYPRRVAEPQLTHVDAKGAARMVDVSGKDVTIRRAVAAGTVTTTATVIDLLHRDTLPKGDAIATARIAGIMGAKRTPDLIPLCHPIALHGVTVELTLREDAIEIEVVVRTADRTGVEMEALTAVATAGLALIDMIKAVDPAASLDSVRVLRKEGGKTGTWTRS